MSSVLSDNIECHNKAWMERYWLVKTASRSIKLDYKYSDNDFFLLGSSTNDIINPLFNTFGDIYFLRTLKVLLDINYLLILNIVTSYSRGKAAHSDIKKLSVNIFEISKAYSDLFKKSCENTMHLLVHKINDVFINEINSLFDENEKVDPYFARYAKDEIEKFTRYVTILWKNL